jgi:peptide methionine sulfoxide reductase MsrB
MCSLFEPGLYSCVCCDTLLFDSNEKFESHTGWPSFTQPLEANVIAYHFDGPAFLKRVETRFYKTGHVAVKQEMDQDQA